MTTPNASPDAKDVNTLLLQIRDQTQMADREAIDPIIHQLSKESNPRFTMDLLAPHLFIGKSDALPLTHHEALSIVMLLASFDGSTYLKPASRAVKNHAVLLTGVTSSSGLDTIVVSDELLSVLVAQLSGSDVEVSANATAAVTACCRRLGPNLSDRAIRAITEAWTQVWEGTTYARHEATTISVRCASAVVDLACLGDASMESAIASGASDLILDMVTDASDPLLQMSTLDLLETLATTLPMNGSRARWLFSKNVLQPLLYMAGQEESPDPILGGPALRLLSTLCRLSQRDSSLFGLGGNELLTGFHHALLNFDARGEVNRLALVDAISSFASASPEALDVCLQDTEIRDSWLSLSVAQPQLKSVILKSVALVLDPPAEVDANGDSIVTSNIPSNALALRLFSTLGMVNHRDATELVLALAKSPFIEIRLGAYSLLEAVTKRGTGAQVLLSHGGYYEFLVNREGETTKEGKEAKHAIVAAVMKSEARGLLAEDIINALDKILKQGPHYVQTRSWDVLIE